MDRLEFEKWMSIAIAREAEANRFYRDTAARATDAAVRKIFADLAADELGHYELLERLKADGTAVLRMNAPPVDLKVAEATDLPPFSPDMKPAEAIALAMKKEQGAVEFYRNLGASASDPGLKGIFNNLANMELGHKQRLENLYTDVGFPESF